VQFLNLGARRGIDQASNGFIEGWVDDGVGAAGRAGSVVGFGALGGRGGRSGVEELDSGEEQFAVELEDLVEFGEDVGADDILYANTCRFYLALLWGWSVYEVA
jgi:hypothetical protein